MAVPANWPHRPLAFPTVEELQIKIDEYFEYCDAKTKEMHSEKLGDMIVPDPQPYTMSGLARRLGVDRHTILNYSAKDPYFTTIRDARNRIQEDVETRLMSTRNEKGAIFNLKNNFSWKDESQQDITSNGQTLYQNLAEAIAGVRQKRLTNGDNS